MGDSGTGFWDDLLEYIDESRVVPVIGADLLRVEHEGRRVCLDLLIAQRLAARLDVSPGGLPEDDALNAVISRYIEAGGSREDIYVRLNKALKDAPLPVPPALRKIAEISHFNLFVTTTFDAVLEQAIGEVRGIGPAAVASIAYAPNDVQDLPAPMARLDRPTVFHLFGRLSAFPDYALTEEDLLEFFYALQSEERRPKKLFQELRNNHLLLIGNRFPDWLARFFIRLARGGRLSEPRERGSSEIVAYRVAGQDRNLVLFLKNFSKRTKVYTGGGAEEFVDELVERYRSRHPAAAPVPSTDLPARAQAGGAAAPGSPQPGSVFLSYAREDQEAVRKIRDALEAANVDVWFDEKRLEAGDEYTVKIRRQIKACSLFVPVISASTQARMEGFFRREWKWAADRAEDIAAGVPFILPACIDDTPDAGAEVPEVFLDMHWSRLPGGQVTPEFSGRIVKLIREYRKRERGVG